MGGGVFIENVNLVNCFESIGGEGLGGRGVVFNVIPVRWVLCRSGDGGMGVVLHGG